MTAAMARPGVPSQFTYSSITPIADSVRFRYPYCALKMNAHSSPFTMGGTAHGSKISARVTREIHTRSSSMTSAIAECQHHLEHHRHRRRIRRYAAARARTPRHRATARSSPGQPTASRRSEAAAGSPRAPTGTPHTRWDTPTQPPDRRAAGRFIQNAKTPTRNSDRRREWAEAPSGAEVHRLVDDDSAEGGGGGALSPGPWLLRAGEAGNLDLVVTIESGAKGRDVSVSRGERPPVPAR